MFPPLMKLKKVRDSHHHGVYGEDPTTMSFDESLQEGGWPGGRHPPSSQAVDEESITAYALVKGVDSAAQL